MPAENIRPIAICVVRRGGDIFVFEARDTIKGETFYRPLGGGANTKSAARMPSGAK